MSPQTQSLLPASSSRRPFSRLAPRPKCPFVPPGRRFGRPRLLISASPSWPAVGGTTTPTFCAGGGPAVPRWAFVSENPENLPFDEYHGVLRVPSFQVGTAPYESEEGALPSTPKGRPRSRVTRTCALP